MIDYAERWPMLAKGLRQMPIGCLKRALRICERSPEKILTSGAIITRSCDQF